jgi:uncharacterized protein (TIGR02996 family)
VASGEELFAAVAASPDDRALREVYADWLEQAGDRRADFVRAHLEVAPLPPDHPERPALEVTLSRARVGLELAWLAVIEPERGPRGDRSCHCYSDGPVALHREPQDTECDAWKRLCDLVEQAAHDQRTAFSPLRELPPEDREDLVTLPASIAKLVAVRELVLYGSYLVRIPPEIGGMTSLRNFVPYTSYRLHWYPYEITRCKQLVDSTVSTRALYGNAKTHMPFPPLGPQPRPVMRPCSVCERPFHDEHRHRAWISRRVATDTLPLLVNACSDACLRALD